MPDSNKPPQDLSPDLKQIYDRVMNTPAKGSSATPPPPTFSPTPTVPPVTSPQNQSVPPVTPQSRPSQDLNPTIPPQPPMQNAEPEPFLTSAPPRPLQGSVGVRSFALGKEKKTEAKSILAGTKEEKKGMSKVLIAILIGIFFVAWSFFWVVFFFNPFA